MTAFGKLIRTTAFRLTLVYLFLFALFAASLLGYFAWNTRRLINEQITATVIESDFRVLLSIRFVTSTRRKLNIDALPELLSILISPEHRRAEENAPGPAPAPAPRACSTGT